MSSLRLALKQSLEESGINPAKTARERERKRAEAEYRKKKLKQQQQQQKRKPGDPPRKRGRPPKNRQLQIQPTQSEHDINDNHDDDSSEVEATFSSDDGFAANEDSDSQREESSHHSGANDMVDGSCDNENEDEVPKVITSSPSNKIDTTLPKQVPHAGGKPNFDEDEDDGYHNQEGEDVDEGSETSERAANKKLQKKQESAANMIKRGWKKKKGIAQKEHVVSSSASSSSSTGELQISLPEESQTSFPAPPSLKKVAKEYTERNKSDSNPQKAKTVPAPSKELIEWMRTRPKKKMKRFVSPGLRVKVRFAARIKRDGKSIRKLKWYGGVVSKVRKDGSKIRIKYDDGTSEITPFPDPDIIVDDESNGQHECEADWFIPQPMECVDVDEPSSPRLEKKTKRPLENFEPDEESTTPPPARPLKKMKRASVVTNDDTDNTSNATNLPPSSEVTVPVPVEPRKIKKKHTVVDPSHVSNVTVEDSTLNTQQKIEPPLPATVAPEVAAPDVSIVADNSNAETNESSNCLGQKPANETDHMTRKNRIPDFSTAAICDESVIATVETVKNLAPEPEKVDRHVNSIEEDSEVDGPKVPVLTLRLSKQSVSSSNDKQTVDDIIPSPGKSISIDVVACENDESFDEEEEDELVAVATIDVVPPEITEKTTAPKPVASRDVVEKEKRPSKRIYIKLDADTVELNGSRVDQDATGVSVERPQQGRLVESSQEENNIASLLNTAQVGEDTDTSSPPPPDNDKPPAVVSLSSKRHGKSLDRGDDDIKPRRLSPTSQSESPTLLSDEPLKEVAKAEVPKPHSTIGCAILDMEKRGASEESLSRKAPILTSSKNSAFSKKEATSSPVSSKATLRISRDHFVADDDESVDNSSVAPRQRGIKSSTTGPRSGRRAAQQANQRISARQDVAQDAIAKKKRKREKIEGRKRDEGDESESSEDDRQWVQCDNCRKWRLLPSNIELSMLPKLWYCEMNTYDPKRSSCVAAEQTTSDCVKEKKRAKKRLRHRAESPVEADENVVDEPTERREPKSESGKRTIMRSPIPTKERDHTLKGSNKLEYDPESKPKRSSPVSGIVGYRSPIPDRDTEKIEKRVLPLSAKKTRIAESSEGASSSDGAVEAIKVKRGRGRARMAKEPDKDQEKSIGAKTTSQDSNEADNVEWVQCEKCDKWRKLPPHISADDLPDVWYCSMNSWNPSSASCDAAEDKADGYTHELSIFGGSPSTSSSKLSYRNLIFGTGKKFNRPISERTRTMESLFAVPADDNDGCPTVMYANSCAFVPRSGLRGNAEGNNGTSGSLSFFDLMKHSNLWAELRGLGDKINNYSCANFVHPYQRRTSFDSFTDDMKTSMKELVCQSLGSRTLAGHEVLLEAQCRQWENVPPAWVELRPYCTVEIVVAALVELVKAGVVELVEEPGSDRLSKDWIPRYRCAHVTSAEPAPASLTDHSARVSRCIKISKPWKQAHSQANGHWMLYS